uniref:F-box-containing protein 1 n=1 Tax=Solanum tuberosum TaxID=4113 RepID=M1D0U6_SOLTU
MHPPDQKESSFLSFTDLCFPSFSGLSNLKALELSDTEVGRNGILQLSGWTIYPT